MSPVGIVAASSETHLHELLQRNGYAVLYFWADWAPQCRQMAEVFDELASLHQKSLLRFVSIEAELLTDACDHYGIATVPSFIVVATSSADNELPDNVLDRVLGANAPQLHAVVSKLAVRTKSSAPATMQDTSAHALPSIKAGFNANALSEQQSVASNNYEEALTLRLEHLTQRASVMLFVKGSPSEPRCGFSRQLIQMLESARITFDHFDILTDEEVRQALKRFANWPTFPQVYVRGEFVGGVDIVKEMMSSGDFQKLCDQ